MALEIETQHDNLPKRKNNHNRWRTEKLKIQKINSISELFGFLSIEFTRQRTWIALLTPILLGGLYSKSLKEIIIKIFTEYWYFAIPVWFAWTLFDLFVLIPGEQTFMHKRSKILNQAIKNNKNVGG